MIFGSVDYKIEGSGIPRLYRRLIKDKIPAERIHEKDGCLYLRLSYEYRRKFEKICNECNCTADILRHNGTLKLFRTLKKRPGLIAGAAAAAALCTYYSNTVMRLEIQTEDGEIQKKIIQALEDEGVSPGTYIPDINYPVVEREVMKRVNEVSWIGISQDGNRLTVDVIENIPKPEDFTSRLPSNLIACENGVIEKMDILDGQVKICTGSGVTKGDIIVGGEIITSKSSWVDGKEVVETKTTYARSIGKVYGTFERVMTFSQPFEERVRISTGREETVRYLNFFSADIPLFTRMPKGYFTSSESVSVPKIFGWKLPIGVTDLDLKEYDHITKKLSENEAVGLAGDKAYRYEQNFLKDYELKDRKCKTVITDKGVELTVTYTLYGVISKESEFFIPK